MSKVNKKIPVLESDSEDEEIITENGAEKEDLMEENPNEELEKDFFKVLVEKFPAERLTESRCLLEEIMLGSTGVPNMTCKDAISLSNCDWESFMDLETKLIKSRNHDIMFLRNIYLLNLYLADTLRRQNQMEEKIDELELKLENIGFRQ